MKTSIVRWLCVVPFLFAAAQTPSTIQVETADISTFRDTIAVHLSKNFTIESSIVVRIDSVRLHHFIYEKSSGTVFIHLDSTQSVPCTLTISYQYLPLGLKQSYSHRTLVFKSDSTAKGKQRAVVTRSEGIFTNMFGPELSKSGSISRGFLVGSNRDLTLNSGFRLQMAGKLSDEIDILAALTDENTPIQPQGNTQTLQEIDNVFVEIKSPVYTATLGDFQFKAQSGDFININRKLQGAKLLAEYQSSSPKGTLQVTGATSRGKFNSNQFQGIEGVQGPYRLTGKNNERAIIIIAGSEKVYIDGETMVRGDNNDYVIDYGSAEVTFSTRRLITGASRIVIDFEYSDRQFTRNFVGVDALSTVSEHFTIQANYFREGDDPDAPIDISLSENDKEILRQSGNTVAQKPGIVLVGTDSIGNGKGNYAAYDSTISGTTIRIFRFEQNTPAALYNVNFSSVGQGNGDYIREGIGRYRFVGIGAGQYAPIIILPTAQLHQLYSFDTKITPLQDLMFEGEYAASNFDQNRFSSIGDNSNSGGAAKFTLHYNPKSLHFGLTDIGDFDIILYERFRQNRFQSLDRIDEVEFGRKWSTDSLASTGKADEEIREGRITYQPAENISFSTGIGSLERTAQFSSLRYDALLDMKGKQYPELTYYIENISGREKTLHISNEWIRHKGSTEYSFARITPSFRYENEHRTVRKDVNDSLESSSYAFTLLAPKVSTQNLYGVDASTELEWRNDDAVLAGQLVPQSSSFTQSYSAAIREVQNFTASAIVTFREKRFEREFQSNNTNQQTTLMKILSRYRPFSHGLDIDLLYDAAAQRTAKLERVFYKVRKGEGQYVWTDANGNGIVDLNDEREFTPDRFDGEYIALTLNSDQLVPIISMKVSSRVRIEPSRFIKNPSSKFEKILTIFSAETFARLEERSTERRTDKIYLLDLNSFLNPATTQMGFQFIQQDIFLFEYQQEYSFRFRFNQRNGLSQFSSGSERNYSRERSLRSRFLISNDIANQTDVILKDDNAVSTSRINPSRQITNTALVTDLSYRPERNIEIGIKIETSQAEDRGHGKSVAADFNGQSIRAVYGFIGNGQIRSEFSREEVLLGGLPSGYQPPYELTSGRDFGKNYLWSVSSEYRMGGNVQFSLQYNGRTTSRSIVVHTGRMEVRAFF
ncbi:MAG: hypothetical protein WCT99_09255 [Bacteroidota bacterium]